MNLEHKANIVDSPEMTKLLLDLVESIETSENVKEFIVKTRTLLRDSGFPLFNISILFKENEQDHLIIYPDLQEMVNIVDKSFAPGNNPQLQVITLENFLSESSNNSESIFTSLINGIICKTPDLIIKDTTIETFNYSTKQFLRDFISLSKSYSDILTDDDISKIVLSEYMGEIISFPVIANEQVIGSLDFVFPQEKQTLTIDETRLLTLTASIVGRGYKNFSHRYRIALSESKYHSIFDATPLAIFTINREHKIISSNTKFKSWYPAYLQETPTTCHQIIFPENGDTPCSNCPAIKTFKTGKETSREIKSMREGKEVYYKIKTSPIVSENGTTTSVMALIEDITTRILAEKKIQIYNIELESEIEQRVEELRLEEKNLIASENKYRSLVENSQDMIILCDNDGNIEFSNKNFSMNTGLKPGKNEKNNIFDYLESYNNPHIRKIIKANLDRTQEFEPLEVKLKKPHESEIWAEISINSIPGHDKLQIVARDITSRKMMESVIENLSVFQEKIVQNGYIGIITMDLNGIIFSCNKGTTNILNYPRADILNKKLTDFIHSSESEETISDFQDRELHPTYQLSTELVLEGNLGDPVSVMYVESVMRDENDKIFAILGFFFDISEKVMLEEKSQLLIMQLNQAQLITILSLAKLTEHRDIETGMHLERIMKYTQLLTKGLAQSNKYKNYITENYISDIINSSSLHDIGKVAIADSILQKPGSLTDKEFDIMKSHTMIGGATIKDVIDKTGGHSFLNLSMEIAFSHHERWDGSGYPKGLKGEDIPLSARIVAVADVYDALTSKRPYKYAYSHKRAMDIIRKSSDSHFDCHIVDMFLENEKEFNFWRESYS